ncbi:MAG TPA: twin-arginine translocase TatA/TatE family subunit [Caulobacteraceae bacterium]|jgi:sec-independent protein translocase protein TatA|nr:twin-arginine translocase TatA/TatE family subunit [Caulobacteraceae bacterium]
MGGLSPWHIVLIVVALLLIFGGGGKLSGLMGDAAKGVKAFKDGLKDEDKPDQPAKTEALPAADRDASKTDTKSTTTS